jgi:hypothetical protein
MRRALLILGLCLGLAAPASAAPALKGRLTVAAPSAAALDLRGAVKPDDGAGAPATGPAASAADLAAPGDLITQASAAQSPLAEAQANDAQCRQACARSYYFCLSADAGPDCAANWGQCRSGCGAQSASPNFGVLGVR